MEIKNIKLLNSEESTRSLSIGSGVVIIKNNKVLLVRGKGGTHFKFPGGHIEDTENFRESALREVIEEIDCTVEIISDPYFYIFKKDDNLEILLIHYLAEIVEGEPKPSTEIEEVNWININNLPENVYDNVVKVLKEIQINPL